MKRIEFRIVADGAERLRAAGGYKEECERLRSALERHYLPPKSRNSVWRRWWIRVQIDRAIRSEMNRRFPPGALHVATVR